MNWLALIMFNVAIAVAVWCVCGNYYNRKFSKPAETQQTKLNHVQDWFEYMDKESHDAWNATVNTLLRVRSELGMSGIEGEIRDAAQKKLHTIISHWLPEATPPKTPMSVHSTPTGLHPVGQSPVNTPPFPPNTK